MSCPCTMLQQPPSGLGSVLDPTFQKVLAALLKHEGGRVQDPDDPGGRTNFGITQVTYTAWLRSKGRSNRDVFNISRSDVEDVYYERYWKAANCEPLALGLATIHFDTAVNMGVGTAKQMLAASGGDIKRYDALRRQRRAAIIAAKPRMKKYQNGWASRDNAVLAAAMQQTTPTRKSQYPWLRPEWA